MLNMFEDGVVAAGAPMNCNRNCYKHRHKYIKYHDVSGFSFGIFWHLGLQLGEGTDTSGRTCHIMSEETQRKIEPFNIFQHKTHSKHLKLEWRKHEVTIYCDAMGKM